MTDIRLDFKELANFSGTTREVGAYIRQQIIAHWKSYDVVKLDFASIAYSSGSLFDEIAKLFAEFPKEEVKRRLKFENIDPWDESLIVHLSKMRLNQQKELEQA